MEEAKDQKCSKCKSYKSPDLFLKQGRVLKSCSDCRIRDVKYREQDKCPHGKQKQKCKECGGSQICEHGNWKYQCKECGVVQKCPHGRRKYQCKECGGSQICPHDKQKSACKDCGGSSICEHNRHKSTCKDCGGSQICEHNRRKYRCKECGDPTEYTVMFWLRNSRGADKKYGRFDSDHFIDTDFLRGLIEDYEFCYYEDCKVKLQYITYQNDLATIERINNNIGHIKSNCVLACMECNRMRKSKATTLRTS